jgi:hypothetical protein
MESALWSTQHADRKRCLVLLMEMSKEPYENHNIVHLLSKNFVHLLKKMLSLSN